MSIPTQTDLVKMDYSYQGKPFVNVPAKRSVNLDSLDFSYQGQPFEGNPFGGRTTGPLPMFNRAV